MAKISRQKVNKGNSNKKSTKSENPNTEHLKKDINLVKKDVHIGAITTGSNGSIVFKNGIEYNINAIKIDKVVDTTGAGDLYASGFLYGLTNTYSIENCGLLGSRSASEIIKYFGARPKNSLKTLLN